MATEETSSRNEVEIDLDKYMKLIDQLDEQEDKIKEMQEEARKAKMQLEPPKRKFMDLFLDDNDINEKSIIGFISFGLIVQISAPKGIVDFLIPKKEFPPFSVV